jgi:hypothetical protein
LSAFSFFSSSLNCVGAVKENIQGDRRRQEAREKKKTLYFFMQIEQQNDNNSTNEDPSYSLQCLEDGE